MRGRFTVYLATLGLASLIVAAVPAPAQAQLAGGPIALMGIDAEDGGPGGHGPSATYTNLVNNIQAEVTNGALNPLLVIGCGKSPSDNVSTFWDTVAPVHDCVNGAAAITAADFTLYRMIAVVSDELNTFFGGLTCFGGSEDEALDDRAADIAAHVNAGGGLLGFTSDCPEPFGYVSGLGTFSIGFPPQYDDIDPTAAGLALGVNDTLDVVAWHDTFLTFPSFLDVLAFRGGTSEAAAIGGSQVVIAPDSLTPAVVAETLPAGGSTEVDKTLHLGGLPAEADIIVAIDTTLSMEDALIDAKADAVQICEDVQDEIPGARFAAVEFQDYPFSPYGIATDDPYELHTTYTADCAAFGVAVAAMTLGNGADLPESNNRVHFEAYSDPALTSVRAPDASRFLVVLADDIPHGVAAFGDCESTDPFSDPGRDEDNDSGGGDDIETLEALDGLLADDHILLYISYISGTLPHPCHVDMAEHTGGEAVADEDAEDIGAFIIAQAEETPYTVDLEISAGCEIGFTFDPDFPQGPFTGEVTINFVETITAPTAVGTYTCTITAVRDPGGPTTAVETVTVTVVPGDPATLDLQPETAENTVDDEHCVTATVEDAFGNPTPGITVEFSVTGPGATEGSATTDGDGEAEFCYTSELPGEDDISAFADTDGDGVQGPGEPSDTATKTWVLPASTAGCRVTYGGWITAANGDRATFGGNARADGLRGEQEYQDHGPAVDMNVHSIDVLAVDCSTDTEASVFGTATVDGSGTFDYRIDLKDLNDTGVSDTYRILLSNGYDSGEQPLEGGNVQIH